MSNRIEVLPRGIRPGDLIDQIDADLSIVQVKVRQVVKRVLPKQTSYRVFFTDDTFAPMYLSARQKITVERQEP